MKWFALVLPLLFIAQLRAEDGERIFNRACAGCHQAGARGVPHTYPELREHLACLARGSDGREYVLGVVSFGLEGEISVDGDHFDGYMPAASALSPAEKAAALNYVLGLSAQCRGPEPPIAESEIANVADDKRWTPDALHTLRARLTSVSSERQRSSGNSTENFTAGRPAHDFNLFCRGCHTERGDAIVGLVPPLKENVAIFMQTESGRAFVGQVPGVAYAPLDDERLAELLNWVVESFSTGEVPTPRYRYTASEIRMYRREPLVDVKATRAQVIAELKSAGLYSPH